MLIARKEPRRHPRVAARWLLRYLEECNDVTIGPHPAWATGAGLYGYAANTPKSRSKKALTAWTAANFGCRLSVLAVHTTIHRRRTVSSQPLRPSVVSPARTRRALATKPFNYDERPPDAGGSVPGQGNSFGLTRPVIWSKYARSLPLQLMPTSTGCPR
jgi:hypothetical protein